MQRMEKRMEIIKLLAYLIIYSFFGWVLESVVKTWIQKKFVNSGFLYGPFCPIYGFGAMIMLTFLERFENNIIFLFLVGVIVLSTWEYIVGWLLEKIFHTKYWDYSENKCNLQGRVCLMNSLFWGILGVLFIKVIHPTVQAQVSRIPQELFIYTSIILTFVIMIDIIVSIIKVLNIQEKFDKLNELNIAIKEKLEELKGIKDAENGTVRQVIEELKYQQTKIKRKLIKQTARLKKAFPSMRSDTIEKINEYLNQKLENMRKERKK